MSACSAYSLAAAMAALPGGAPTFLAVSIVAFIILGSVLEGIPAIVLFGPTTRLRVWRWDPVGMRWTL